MSQHAKTAVDVFVPHKKPLGRRILDNWQLYLLLLIPVVLTIIYKYIPMYGIQIAFRDFKASRGYLGSQWVGLYWFERFFSSPTCVRMIKNTVLISLYSLLWTFPIPIILSLIINQLRFRRYKRLVQTVLYAPHFISIMVVCGMLRIFLSPSGGLINLIFGTSIDFLTESSAFRTIYIASGIWQDAGWGCIIYLATLANVDPGLYEAAKIDGASVFQRIKNIDLPELLPMAILNLIMAAGGLMNVGFEYIWPLFIILALAAIAFFLYGILYFKSKRFLSIKEKIQSHIQDCNDLNHHIEDLKNTSLVVNRTDYGEASYQDASRWNVKREALKSQRYAPYIYDCSRTVCDNARKEPFKYICKYFGIKADEETLEKFEAALNDFSAAEDGKVSLKKEREAILASIHSDIPFLIKKFFSKKLEKELGFEEVDFSTLYFPKYEFKYVSAGGNTSTIYDVVMDIDNLNRFVLYLSEKIKFKKSAAGQRALMTSRLREQIKERDHYTCRYCGASLSKEPNLLLEIDHIVPVSKGGLTTEDNLQTLCWRCNRSKGNKLPA